MSSPYISGITFIKDGLTLGYPIAESIQSIEPLCDEIIINVGFNNPACTQDDGTEAFLREQFKGKKFKFIKSYWDPEMQSKGLILSQQTNIALEQARGRFIHYIQGDEVVHEDDLELILQAVKELETHPSAEGLVYDYLHFYGNVDVIRRARTTYRREVRLIKNGLGLRSWLDAQGFRHQDECKVKAILTKARIFHYGWARADQVMKKKVKAMDRLWAEGKEQKHQEFSYERVWGLEAFRGVHPKIMHAWIEKNRNDLDILNLPTKFEWVNIKLTLSKWIEDLTGKRIGEFTNYQVVR